MPQFLKDLYAKNKVLAWIIGIIIVPVIIIFSFKDVAMSFLAKGAQKDINDATAKNKELQKDIDATKIEIAKQDTKVEMLDKKVEEIKKDEDEDWHKKR